MGMIDKTDIAAFKASYSFNFNGRLIKNEKDIYDACRYIYTVKHVLFKTRKFAQKYAIPKSNTIAIAKRNAMLKKLVDRVWTFFNLEPNTPNDQPNFDKAHEHLCDTFLKDLNDLRAYLGYPPATYGNAQKMINILFKYLVCFEDYPDFADLFSFAHMPIDNYILRGCFLQLGVPGVCPVPYDMKYNGMGWYELDKAHYLSLLNAYRTTLDPLKSPDLSYLGLEFHSFPTFRGFPTTDISAKRIDKFHFPV